MKSIFNHVIDNLGLYILLVFFSLLFLFHLDYSTLSSWDEAWYGVIARDMVRTGDILRMHFNTLPFFDHPPAGFWLMAISYKLLGISELSTRLPSALCGIGTILLIYLTSKALFGKKSIGIVASLIMGTCVWYVLRVRSGNLDSTFVFFYILTIYTAIQSRKNIRWFVPTMISFALLFLTKTLVGASAILLIGLINSNHILTTIKNPKKEVLKYLCAGIMLAAIIILPWYIVQFFSYHNFYQHHFVDIGTRNKTLGSYFSLTMTQPLFYLHMGIRKWYYFWLASIGIVFITRDFLKKRAMMLLFWNALVLYPFLTTDQTQIWHLIPVYLPIALVTSYGWWRLGRVLPKPVGIALFVIGFSSVAFFQVKSFYPEVIQSNKFIADDVAIAKASHSLTQKVFLDDDFLPLAVYYADRTIYPLRELGFYHISGNKDTLVNIFKSDETNFAVITRNWALNNLKSEKIPYTIITQNKSFAIVTK